MKRKHKANNVATNKVLDGKKKILFNIILLLIPIILFLLFEFGLRIFKYGNDLSLFLKSENYPGYYEMNPNVNYRYFTKLERTSSTKDVFLIEKPDTCFRIFVFGESTTRGYPYQAGTSFPTILYYRLQDVFPDKRIEVVNLAASAINSYSYVDMLDEVLKNEPDLILVYGGHNEYYGALGVGSVENGGNARWLKKLRLKLCRLRTFQLVQNLIIKSSTIFANDNNRDSATLMERIVKDKDILINSKKYNEGIEQYRVNMTELVKRAQKRNIPVVISDLVNNLKDQPPFKSSSDAKYPAAIDVFNEAKSLEEQGKVNEAKELYYKAKDLDVVRFRSPEAINEVIYKLCQQYQLPLVPMKRYFEKESPNQLIGNSLILEHLHPNVDGYFLMTDAFFNTLKENKLISRNWDSSKIKPSTYYRNNWGFTELDSLIGDLHIQSLKAGWPYKPENEINRFLATYQYKGFIDSIAYSYVTSETKHIEDEHIKLAQYYSRNGMNDKAFNEYFSLIKLHPYIGDLYYDASRYLIAQQKFPEALSLIYSAPLMDKNYFYYYMVGTLKLKIGEINNAIRNLEHAYKIITPDAKPLKVLMPLYLAYRENGDRENENRIAGIIKKYNPDFRKESEENIQKPEVKNLSLDETLNLAESFLNKKDLNGAMELLLSANKIKETAKADKWIGMIYLLKKENKLAYSYCMRSYQLDSNDYENLNNLFILCLLNNDLNTATKVLDQLRVMNIDPNKIQRLENLYNKKKKELGVS